MASDASTTEPIRLPIQRITIDELEAAEALGVSVHFLRKDRRTKRRVPFFRLGDRVLYSLERVREALAAFRGRRWSAGRGAR
jgi:hypothetical protein